MTDTSTTADSAAEGGRQTLGFQAEVKQLLHLMVHSLYSNKEISRSNLTEEGGMRTCVGYFFVASCIMRSWLHT